MIIYLVHLNRPLGNLDNPRGQARHYLGSTDNLKGRMYYHRHGCGSKLLAAAVKAGIKFRVVRTWEADDRELEFKLKALHNHAALCPICSRKHRKPRKPNGQKD